ncbi:MAG: hypothetical protein DRR08_11470 [Candidatus Parabeggiatoa sp. nov. 2]|nr:MAG: hypothetical protein B6247_19470 [Beggiatoa sp. 4572_84]RKZ60393.1 MAG: hypothetical protein DRR08_11470 [Gammaproteobacteria bacterium]
MTELVEFKEIEYQEDEVREMPSRNHSFVQTRIASLLFNDERFTPFVELSLDASQIDLSQFGLKAKDELIPDVCVYPSSVGFNDDDDDLKMLDMPLLAIEIISPRQGISDIIAKFKAYFALGVKSCWLITPAIKAATIYSQPNRFKTFSMDTAEVDTEVNIEIIDKAMDIHLPIHKLFKR